MAVHFANGEAVRNLCFGGCRVIVGVNEVKVKFATDRQSSYS